MAGRRKALKGLGYREMVEWLLERTYETRPLDSWCPDACWELPPGIAARAQSGYYNQWRMPWGSDRLHRVVLAWKLGRALGEGKHALHHCDNKGCLNPGHLYEGTAGDNTRDWVERGRRDQHGVRNPRGRFTVEQIAEVRRLYHEEGLRQGVIAERFGMNRSHVSRILSGKVRRRG